MANGSHGNGNDGPPTGPEPTEETKSEAKHEEQVVVFADIVGYSKMAHGLGDAAAVELVDRLVRMARGPIDNSGGRLIRTEGDLILACWPKEAASTAIRIAASLLERLEQDNRAQAPGKQIHVRVGVHCSDVMVVEGGNVIGDGVNLARRIQEGAVPDEVLVSREAKDAGDECGHMPTCRHVGLIRCKGIEEPVDVFSVDPKPERHVRRAVKEAVTRAFNPMQWRIGSWVIFAVGVLFTAGSLVGVSESPRGAASTATTVGIWLLGWAMLWAAYRPRTVSLWHPVVRVALLGAWSGVAMLLGWLVGAYW